MVCLTYCINAQSLIRDWAKAYGGTKQDFAGEVLQTYDGGYIMCGLTYSIDGDVLIQHVPSGSVSEDVWIVKTDSAGDLQWQLCLGGTSYESGGGLIVTSDSGYVLTGRTCAVNGNLNQIYNGCDAYVLKINKAGTIEWQTTIGGSREDNAASLRQTSDNGFIFIGQTHSRDNDGVITGFHGTDAVNGDIVACKLTANGTIEWLKCLGGTEDETVIAGEQTADGGYIIGGSTRSNDGDITGNHHPSPTSTGKDFWVVKLTSIGDIQWQKCYGALYGEQEMTKFLPTRDGGFIAAGTSSTTSLPESDINCNNYTGGWLIKSDNLGAIQWQSCNYRLLGKQTNDDGFIVLHTGLVTKIDSSGNIQWASSFQLSNWGDPNYKSFLLDNDGGYFFTGTRDSNNTGIYIGWYGKLDSNGHVVYNVPGQDIFINDIIRNNDGNYVVAGSCSSTFSGYHGNMDYGLALYNIPPDNCLAAFTLQPNPLIQHDWFAVNQATGNGPLTYVWSWGDGTSSTGAAPSHTYSAPGYYNICLSIADSAGCTDTYCDSSTYIFKADEAVITVNVVHELPTAVEETKAAPVFTVFPNPADNRALLVAGTDMIGCLITITDIAGKILNTLNLSARSISLPIENLSSGMYFISISNGNQSTTRKLIIQK